MASRFKRKSKHKEPEEDPEFQVAPMIDVLLVLLMFFMSITSTEVMKKVANLELPDASHAKDKSKSKNNGEVVINVGFQGKGRPTMIEVDARRYQDPSALTPMLLNRVSLNPNIRVLIRADKSVEYSAIADVMRACAGAQIGNVTFAVIRGGEPGAAQPGATAPAEGG